MCKENQSAYERMINRDLSSNINVIEQVAPSSILFLSLVFFYFFLIIYIYVYKCYPIIVVEEIINNDEKTSTSIIHKPEILSDHQQTEKDTSRTFNNRTLSKFYERTL